MSDKKKSALCGALAGMVNGFFGGGGGMIFIPLITRWTEMDTHKAFATCVGVILPMTAISAGVYMWRGSLDWHTAMPYMLGGTLGGIAAGKLFKKVPAKYLKKFLALLILYGGWRNLTC